MVSFKYFIFSSLGLFCSCLFAIVSILTFLFYGSRREFSLAKLGVKSLIKKVLICFILVFAISISYPFSANANIKTNTIGDGTKLLRSLESLRDIDYETWQVIAYQDSIEQKNIILRIVGFPGTLRIDHPLPLKVHAGLKDWELEDITLSNPQLVNDSRAAAAEFLISPLLLDLRNNKPLRMQLAGAFADLPIPPYLVKEWRSLQDPDFSK